MSENLNLTDIINEALNNIEPTEVDNQEESQDEDLVPLDLEEVEDTSEESDIEEDSEYEEELEEEEVETEEDIETEDESDGESYIVKVDGEEYEVTLDELVSGYSRQAHFTKSMQALKEEREAFQAEVAEYQDTLGQLAALDEAWESNPVSVMTSLLGSTENPSYYLGLIIKEAAANDLLSEEALQYFGIDAETKRAWSTETEMERLRREIKEREEADAKRSKEYQAQVAEARVQEAIKMYDNQVTEIIATEGLDFPTSRERSEFKAELLRYAHDNNILDLHKAYAALAYEKNRQANASQKRRAASHEKKAATRVVSRRGAGSSSVTKVDNAKDLRSVIESSMRELNF